MRNITTDENHKQHLQIVESFSKMTRVMILDIAPTKILAQQPHKCIINILVIANLTNRLKMYKCSYTTYFELELEDFSIVLIDIICPNSSILY